MALLNLASLCNRGFGQLANGLFEVTNETLKKNQSHCGLVCNRKQFKLK